jgi:hypothetical protein
LSVVLVGNASSFAFQLKSIGFTPFETVGVENLDLMTVDFKRPVRTVRRVHPALPPPNVGAPRVRPAAWTEQQPANPAPRVVAQEGEAARALLTRVVTAKGGLTTLRGIRNIVAVTQAAMVTPDGKVDSQTTTYLQYPNRVRVETRLPDATIVQGYDGARAWVKDPSGIHDVPPQLVRELETGLRRDTVAVLLAAVDGQVRARLLPDVKNAAGEIHHALELSASGLDPMILHINPKTNLIAKQTYVAGGPGTPLMEEVFGDYKPVDGVQIAFTAEVRRDGAAVLERHISDIRINQPLDASLFARPRS